MADDWKPIATAPFQTVIEVRNKAMAEPTLATRGYQTEAGVHPDDTFCTSVFTPDKSGIHCLGFPAGKLVCPSEWREAPNA